MLMGPITLLNPSSQILLEISESAVGTRYIRSVTQLINVQYKLSIRETQILFYGNNFFFFRVLMYTSASNDNSLLLN